MINLLCELDSRIWTIEKVGALLRAMDKDHNQLIDSDEFVGSVLDRRRSAQDDRTSFVKPFQSALFASGCASLPYASSPPAASTCIQRCRLVTVIGVAPPRNIT